MAGRRRGLRRFALVALLALFALAGVAGWLWKCVFVVEKIVVQGSGASAGEVVAASGVRIGTSVFALREEEIRAGVDALGTAYVEEYQLRLPNKLILKVRKREPVAMLRCGAELVLIDEAGCAVEAVGEAPDRDLIYVSGAGEVSGFCPGKRVELGQGRTALYCEAVAALKARRAGMYVSEMNLEDPGNLRLITRGGIVMELGGGAELDERMALMCAAAADLEGRGVCGGTLRMSGASRADYSPPGRAAEESG